MYPLVKVLGLIQKFTVTDAVLCPKLGFTVKVGILTYWFVAVI